MSAELQVMKFGGTSVGDAECIGRTAQIIAKTAKEKPCVVVVSAMSGVTNTLIAAAKKAATGEAGEGERLVNSLRAQHAAAMEKLIGDGEVRKRVAVKLDSVLSEARRLCDGTALLRELTPRTLDEVSSLGERLSAPIVAEAVKALGLKSEAIEATELIVTDAYHGGAEPRMDLTREKSQARLKPLLAQGVVPVVTGFIGATSEGKLTTLGRGGSDYSATILGAALDASEVVIWTDVEGVLTADPRLVPDARTIPEISYREAAELAYFGAKVLHPKTLNPVVEAGIPVWIRNSLRRKNWGRRLRARGGVLVAA
jgi:bifunctional aspartokinase / homoserine dehydrogenase 1